MFFVDRKELEKWLGEPLDNKNNKDKDYSEEDNEYEQKYDSNQLDNLPMSDGLSAHFRPNFTLPKEIWGNDEIVYESSISDDYF